jgi:hypothetical protein
MTKELETLYATVLIFGILSAVLYMCVLRPFLPAPQPPGNAGVTVNSSRTTTGSSKVKAARVPPHVSEASARTAIEGGRNLLQDNGIVKWQHSRAADCESQEFDRKERARLLSRLLSSSPPPAKGSNIVLAVPGRDAGCRKLRHALYLLSTYYNLIVLLVVEPDFDGTKEKAALLRRLRGESGGELETDVLPDHRVVLACTAAGRVAFCRQMHRIELVLDFDLEVKNMLSRFGYRVTLYGEGLSSGSNGDEYEASSILGKALLSS